MSAKARHLTIPSAKIMHKTALSFGNKTTRGGACHFDVASVSFQVSFQVSFRCFDVSVWYFEEGREVGGGGSYSILNVMRFVNS